MQPPCYAKILAIYLNDVVGQRLSILQDSMIMVRLYGEDSTHIVDENVSGRVKKLPSTVEQNQKFLAV